jgi:uncharacterized membrane protein YqjE
MPMSFGTSQSIRFGILPLRQLGDNLLWCSVSRRSLVFSCSERSGTHRRQRLHQSNLISRAAARGTCMYERLKETALPHTVAEVAADLADLFQKELRLAKAEINAKIAAKLNAGIWMSVAAGLSLMALFIALQAIIFAIVSFGLAMHWACLIVAVALFVVSGVAFVKGRADAREPARLDRTIQQVKRDVSMAKEQLT